MNYKSVLAAAALCVVASASAAQDAGRELKVSADRMAADNVTGALVASGHVNAVMTPFRMMSEEVSRTGDTYVFAEPTTVTTCTNDEGSLHWSCTGNVVYREGKEVVARDMTLKMFGLPVFWVPYWWQPLDTDYGWRVMPGYRSRWGAYLLTK